MRVLSIRNSYIASIAALAASLNATMEDAPAEPKNDAEFIKAFAAKADAAEAAEKVKRDEAKPAPVTKVKAEAKEVVADDASAGGGEEDEDAYGEDDASQPGDDADGDDDADAGDDDAKDKDDDSEFGKRAKDAKLPTSIDDLPEEARPLVQKRLKEMESGFTRLMQKQAEFRTERRAIQTEERYRTTHKVEWLVGELLKDPQLEEKVAAELEKLREDSPYLREAASVVAQDHRAKAAKEIADQEAEERKESERLEREDREQAKWVAQRGSDVETLARKACSKNGIQFDRGVEAAIAYEISEQGDIEDSRIAAIVKEMADERGKSTRAVRREEKKRHVQGKTEAARSASPIRPGQGRSGGPTRPAATPATLEENMMAFADKAFPGEP